MLITPVQPFDLSLTLRFVLSPPALPNNRQFAPLLDYLEDGEYRRIAHLGDEPVLYGVRQERDGNRTNLRLRAVAGLSDERALGQIENLARRQFSTHLDLQPFYRLVAADPVLARLTEHFCGMRIPQAVNIFETLISAILEQQVNLSFAHQVKQALIENYGMGLEFQGRRYNAFPEPAALAISTPRELRRIQVSGPKARYIIAIARAVVDGSLDLEGLRSLDPRAADAKLRAYKGVGTWTAQYVGLRALGHLDSLPAADVGLQKAIQRFYGLRKLPTPARVEQIARRWAGWRSYATFYLWLTYWEDRAWNERFIEELAHSRRSQRRQAGN
ncbi:MAG: DNA-3-methyladenine glycosylase 2 [Acidobacteriia bacterium]|nr:DNA-3-methyladenine glycosylase 2 [Terriglobia bacterium]